MNKPIYQLLGIDMAIQLLRPDAEWEIYNNSFTKWNDPRPCPTFEEIYEVINKLRELEESINTIYLEKHTSLFEQQA